MAIPAFRGVQYWINRDISSSSSDFLKDCFGMNGGQAARTRDSATHIITMTIDQPTPSREGVHLVTPEWVRKSVKLGSKQEERFYSPDPAMLFSSIVGCADGLPKADVEVIQAGIVGLGGQWRGPLTKEVTHLFVMKAEGDKYTTAVKHAERTGIKVVLPHWFDDSFKAAHLVSTDDYEFPNPRLFGGADDLGDLSPEELVSRRKKPDDDIDMVPNSDVFDEKAVILSSTLDLSPERREAFENRLRRAGARLVEHVDDAQILVTTYQEGDEFFKAFTDGKTVGTLDWLIYVLREDRLSSPRDQLLHFPHPRGPCPGFADLNISITTYTGVARDYIKHVIEALGGTFTATMDSRNTHLIAGGCIPNQPKSAKITSAENWGIPVVNHLWLEDCLADWQLKHLASERYLSLSVQFGGIVGDRRRMNVRLPPEWQKGKKSSLKVPLQPLVQVRSSTDLDNDMDVDYHDQPPPVEEEDEVELVIANPTLTPRSPAKSSSSSRAKLSPQVSRTPKRAIPNSTPGHASVLSKGGPRTSPSKPSSSTSNTSVLSKRGPPTSPSKPSSSSSAKRRRLEKKPSEPDIIDIPTDESASPPVDPDRSPSPVARSSRSARVNGKMAAKPRSSGSETVGRAVTPPGFPSAGRVRRSAAVAATSKLASNMQDANQFEVEMRGRRKSAGLSELRRIKVPGEQEEEEQEEEEEEEESSDSEPTLPEQASDGESEEEEPPRKQGRAKKSMKENTPITVPTKRVNGKGKLSKPSGSKARAVAADMDVDEDEDDREDGRHKRQTARKLAKKRNGDEKRTADTSDNEVVVLEESKPVKGKKRGRSAADSVTPAPAGEVWIMTTMCDASPSEKKKLEALGARFTTEPNECTHLVVKGINRTEKFLCALPRNPEIVTSQWVTDSAARGELLPESDYPVKDAANEKLYAFSLAKARENARKNHASLLKGHIFLLTPNVPNLAQIRRIVKANGGECQSLTGPPSVRGGQDSMKHLVSHKDDSSYWRGWAEAGHEVYSSEVVLRGCLRQDMRWSEEKVKLLKD